MAGPLQRGFLNVENLSYKGPFVRSVEVQAPVAPMTVNEEARVKALKRYAILDTGPEDAFDDVAALARQLAGTPMAMITLIDSHRAWLKARIGLDVTEAPREESFCAHAILEPQKVLEVPDARLDSRFATLPSVTMEPGVQFYAGAPLVTADGYALGTVCVLDTHPRTLTDQQRDGLERLARTVMAHFEARRVANALLSVTDVLDELRVLANGATLRQIAEGLVALLARVLGADGAAVVLTGSSAEEPMTLLARSAGALPVPVTAVDAGPASGLVVEAVGAALASTDPLVFQPAAPWVGPEGSSVLLNVIRGERRIGVLAAWWEAPVSALEPTVERVLEVLGHEAGHMIARQLAVEALTIEANTDALTGLANRRCADLLLDELPSAVTLVMLDLDRFKGLNDTLGHAAGDDALRDFGYVLRQLARSSDLVCRWGGDEFMLAFPHAHDAEVLRILDRLRKAFLAKQPELNFSAGLAERQAGEPVWVTLAAADLALYEAKVAGRGRDVFLSGR